jgi:multiple sugar transport system permease protein
MLQQRRARLAYFLVLPALTLVVILNLVPLVQGVIISMQNQNMIRPNPEAFVGLRHYTRALTDDGEFWRSTWHSFYFTISAVAGAYALSLGLALLLNQSIRARGLFRALFLIPWVVPEVVTALLWKWVYSDQWGIANFALVRLGIVEAPVLWLSDPHVAMPSVIIVQIWKLYPIMTVVLLAALQSVPKELIEAAKIDGANAFQRFWYVTANFLRPTSIIIVLLGCIWTFQNFDIVYLLTGGGPAGSTQTLPVMVYVKAFWASQLGYASAIGVIILVILLMLGFASLFLERVLARDRRAAHV